MTEIPKSEVSSQVADQIHVGPPPVQLSGGRSYRVVAVIIALAVLAAAAAFAWLSYGDRLAEMSGTASPAAPASVGDSVATAEFTAFQAQTSASLQSATQLLTSQQAELKRLSDQLAALTSRIDGLQGTIAAAAPSTASSAPAVAAPVAAPRPTAPRKRPVAPAGAISVGGAPLPGAGSSAR